MIQINQIFIRFAHTHSPIESYNNNIKVNFTCRLKHNLIPAIQILILVVSYESNKIIDFKTFGCVNKSMMNRAYRLIRNKLLIHKAGRFEYTRDYGSSEIIKTRPLQEIRMSCTCSAFLDKAMCHHMIAASVIDNVRLPGIKKVSTFIYPLNIFNFNLLIIYIFT